MGLIITNNQVKFIHYYFGRKSRTRGNAYQSAIKAGYSKSFARVITTYYKGRRLRALKPRAKEWHCLLELTREVD